jgi:hypothetical protein
MAVNVIYKITDYELAQLQQENFDKYLKIIKWGRRHPTRFMEEILQLQFTDHQKYILMSMWNASTVCILASRASGKSFLLAPYIQARSILYPNYNTCILAPTGGQAKLLFAKIENLAKHKIGSIKNSSDVFLNEIIKSSSDTDGFVHGSDSHKCELFNGSKIFTLNGAPKNNVGERVHCLVYDEAGKIPRETFSLCDPFIALDPDFLTGNINKNCMPKQMRNQKILASSAESIDTELFAVYKDCALKMIQGNRDFFVVDLNCEMSLHPTMNGMKFDPLISQQEVDNALALNELRALREYFNIFDGNNAENSVVRRSAIERNSFAYAPTYQNPDGNSQYFIIYDPAERIDNSVIGIFELFRDSIKGLMLRVVNMVNFIEILPNGTKTHKIKPEQVKDLKKIMLAYNGTYFGVADYKNIHLMIDPGSGGGGTSIAAELLSDWHDEFGIKHFGVIDKQDKKLVLEAPKFPEAKEILTLPQASGVKLEMFEAVSNMIDQDLVMFPKTLNLRGEMEFEQFEKIDGKNDEEIVSVKYLKMSKQEVASLTEIELMREEICALQKIKTPNGNVTIKLPANLENKKIHDDRAYVLAMACWRLSELRKKEMLHKNIPQNDLSELYKKRQGNGGVNSNNPFGKIENPFGNMINPFMG